MTSQEIKELRQEYLETFPSCQYRPAVGRWDFMVNFPSREGNCVDHIWGRGKYSEHWTNYATVCPEAHAWKTEEAAIQARIAITNYKWKLARMTGDWRHFDRDVIRKIIGKDVIGLVEMWMETSDLPSWCIQAGEELVRGNAA